jgi:subtilisin
MKIRNSLITLGLISILAGCSESSNQAVDTIVTSDTTIDLLTKSSLPARLIIEGSDLGSIAAEIAKSGGDVVRNMDFIDALVANVPPQALNGLKKKFPDISITEDKVLSLVAKPAGAPIVQPAQSIPYGIKNVKADLAWSTSRGLGVKVCVIDTGVDKSHPDLAANLAGGKNYVRIQGVVDANRYDDDNGHGTHVSGTIAAVDNAIGVVGVAPSAKIYAVKVLNKQGSGYVSDITDGIYDCVNAGAKVINMSLGGSGDPSAPSAFKDAINAAVANGVYVVAAAGNEDRDISTTTPAGYPNVIAVAAVDQNYNFASWSNFGLKADDFAAPGVSILSTWKGGAYNTISGTSMASPHVAGVIALGVAAGSLGPVGRDLGKPLSQQGGGFIDALLTLAN